MVSGLERWTWDALRAEIIEYYSSNAPPNLDIWKFLSNLLENDSYPFMKKIIHELELIWDEHKNANDLSLIKLTDYFSFQSNREDLMFN